MLVSDTIRKLYYSRASSIPSGVLNLLSKKQIDHSTLPSGKPLLNQLKNIFDGLQDSFFTGGILPINVSPTVSDAWPKKMTISYRGIDGSDRVIDFPSQIYSSKPTGKQLTDIYVHLSEHNYDELFKELNLTMNKPYQQLLVDAASEPIPADRITGIKGLDIASIVEGVRVQLYPQEPKIVAKVRIISVFSTGDYRLSIFRSYCNSISFKKERVLYHHQRTLHKAILLLGRLLSLCQLLIKVVI